jgi:outer membrane protein assembly factor BamE
VFPVHSRRLLACAAAALALCSCQTMDTYVPTWRTFGIYKLEINQGNYLTSDKVDKLKVGMTKAEVQSVLGTALLADPFHADRWDYLYRETRQGRLRESRDFHVYFTDGKLARWEGDEMPQSPIDLNRIAAEHALQRPDGSDKSWWDKMFDVFHHHETPPEAAAQAAQSPVQPAPASPTPTPASPTPASAPAPAPAQ